MELRKKDLRCGKVVNLYNNKEERRIIGEATLIECLSSLKEESERLWLDSYECLGVYPEGTMKEVWRDHELVEENFSGVEKTTKERYWTVSKWRVKIGDMITTRWIPYFVGGAMKANTFNKFLKKTKEKEDEQNRETEEIYTGSVE